MEGKQEQSYLLIAEISIPHDGALRMCAIVKILPICANA